MGRPVMQTEAFLKEMRLCMIQGKTPCFHYRGGNFSNIFSTALLILFSFSSGLLLPVGSVENLVKFFGPGAKSGLDITPLL